MGIRSQKFYRWNGERKDIDNTSGDEREMPVDSSSSISSGNGAPEGGQRLAGMLSETIHF